MVFNIISAVDEVVTWYDLTDILSVMISCTATFVAIIGGLIANKAISDTAEKESIDIQLQQIDAEMIIIDKELKNLYSWIEEYDAMDFISNNLDSLLDGLSLSEIYNDTDNNDIEYDVMLHYWNKALEVISQHSKVSSNETNSDKVPIELVGKIDSFQYKICSHFGISIKNGNKSLSEEIMYIDTGKYRVQFFNENMERISNYKNKENVLIANKKLLQKRNNKICISKDIKEGMKIFGVISAINIILPTIFMLFNPTSNKVWYYIETVLSFIAFSVGIIVMIRYIYTLFPKKTGKTEQTVTNETECNDE